MGHFPETVFKYLTRCPKAPLGHHGARHHPVEQSTVHSGRLQGTAFCGAAKGGHGPRVCPRPVCGPKMAKISTKSGISQTYCQTNNREPQKWILHPENRGGRSQHLTTPQSPAPTPLVDGFGGNATYPPILGFFGPIHVPGAETAAGVPTLWGLYLTLGGGHTTGRGAERCLKPYGSLKS